MNGALQAFTCAAHVGAVLDADDRTRLAGPTDSVDDTIHRGQQAWMRLRNDNTWPDWIAVGKAHVIGQGEAMREAGVNRPNGHRFDKAFSAWRKRHGFDDLDKGDRSRLFKVMDHLAQIEAWRATLTTTERLKINHPNTVLRKWQAATSVPTAGPDAAKKPTPTEKLEQELAAQIEENHRLKREVESGGGDLWSVNDRPQDIARVMVTKLSRSKAERVAKEIMRLLAEKREPAPT